MFTCYHYILIIRNLILFILLPPFMYWVVIVVVVFSFFFSLLSYCLWWQRYCSSYTGCSHHQLNSLSATKYIEWARLFFVFGYGVEYLKVLFHVFDSFFVENLKKRKVNFFILASCFIQSKRLNNGSRIVPGRTHTFI